MTRGDTRVRNMKLIVCVMVMVMVMHMTACDVLLCRLSLLWCSLSLIVSALLYLFSVRTVYDLYARLL